MATPTNISIRPFHVRATIGYSCTTAWGVLVLLNSIFGTAANMTPAVASMLPGLVTCLLFLFAFRSVPSLGRESAFVRIGALLMAAGTFLCTYPPLATVLATRLIGLVVSGALAIVVVMAWFDVFARQSPRAVIVMAGCSATVSAVMCWIVLVCPTNAGSVLISLLPLLAYALLPPPPRTGPRRRPTPRAASRRCSPPPCRCARWRASPSRSSSSAPSARSRRSSGCSPTKPRPSRCSW